MIIYTLEITDNTVRVHDGQLPRSRLRYIAPDFRVYTKGAVTTRKLDIVAYHAVSLAISHHIPAMKVERYCECKGSKNDH